jgi:hypothetical protein
MTLTYLLRKSRDGEKQGSVFQGYLPAPAAFSHLLPFKKHKTSSRPVIPGTSFKFQGRDYHERPARFCCY